ncbi:MAG: phosphotransferase, partial [Terracidiphilus sp.]
MSATAIAHGMDGRLVTPDWAPLKLAEVRELLRQFPGCCEPIKILSVSPRPFSAASVVATLSGRVFVKRHHRSVRDRDGLLEEHRFLAHLLTHGAAVPRVFANVAGESAIEMDEWTYEVHEAPVGVDLYGEALSWTPFRTEAHARSAGSAMARMHLASEGFDAPRRRVRPLVASYTIFSAQDAGAGMDRYVNARAALAGHAMVRRCCDEALELLAPFHAKLRPLLPALKPLW